MTTDIRYQIWTEIYTESRTMRYKFSKVLRQVNTRVDKQMSANHKTAAIHKLLQLTINYQGEKQERLIEYSHNKKWLQFHYYVILAPCEIYIAADAHLWCHCA